MKRKTFWTIFICFMVISLLLGGCGGDLETSTCKRTKLVLTINLPKTRNLTFDQRRSLEEAQKQKIERINCNLWDIKKPGNSYFRRIYDIEESMVIEFHNLEITTYRLYISASQGTHNLFESKTLILLQEGKPNQETISLTLSEWQPVKITLSEEYAGEDECIHANGNFENNTGFGCCFNPSDNRLYIIGSLPLRAKEIRIEYDYRVYQIDPEIVLNHLIDNQPIYLYDCESEPIVELNLNVNFADNYVVVPTDFPTIQSAIDGRESSDTFIKILSGTYYEQITIRPGTKLIGDIFYPNNVIIKSDKPNTLIGTIGTAEAEISGLTIYNSYAGEKIYSTAAVFFELGFNLKMDYCIIKVTGDADCISCNYNQVNLSNLTLIGNNNKNTTGIGLYNTSSNNLVASIIFYNLYQAIKVSNKQEDVKHSLFWNVVREGDILSFETNYYANPYFLPDSWYFYTPSIDAPAIKLIMENSNNYPGAILPMNPPLVPTEE